MLSIVTVCRNAVEDLKKTIESVQSQIDQRFEYFVVDGNSTDDTVIYLNSVMEDMKQRGVKFKYISEPDSGIYNAMNKSMDLVTGDWILFLNAGDMLASDRVVYKINQYLNQDNLKVDFIYGDVLICDNGREYIEKCRNIDSIIKAIPFCHQSIVNNKKTLLSLRYNEQYKICADYDAYLRAYKKGKIFRKTDLLVSKYQVGGISYNNAYLMAKEMLQIKKANGVRKGVYLSCYTLCLKIFIKRILGRMYT